VFSAKGVRPYIVRRRPRASEEVMTGRLREFFASQSGATAIEYGLITALIAVAIIATLISLTSSITNTFNEVSSNLK
jgi:pilus assembly protein Flp/PilA